MKVWYRKSIPYSMVHTIPYSMIRGGFLSKYPYPENFSFRSHLSRKISEPFEKYIIYRKTCYYELQEQFVSI